MGWWQYARAGQRIMCVGCKGTPKPLGFWEQWQKDWNVTTPQRGVVYTLRDIRMTLCGKAFIRVNEIRNPIIQFIDAPDDEPWWAAVAFRPAQSTETGMKIIRSILDRAPVKEDA